MYLYLTYEDLINIVVFWMIIHTCMDILKDRMRIGSRKLFRKRK